MPKALDISRTSTWVASDQLKALAVWQEINLGRSELEREDLNHTGNQKKGHISCGGQ